MGATEVLGAHVRRHHRGRVSRAPISCGFSVRSARPATRRAPSIVTGDTKVMGRGELDGIVLNTTGIALTDRVVPDSGLRAGDVLIVTGTIGDHGMAVMARRHGLALDGDLRSDVAPLNG